MSTQTMERQGIHQKIELLSDSTIKILVPLIDALAEKDSDEWEDADDIAYIEAHRDEPAIPFEEVVREFEAKHGPLYQN